MKYYLRIACSFLVGVVALCIGLLPALVSASTIDWTDSLSLKTGGNLLSLSDDGSTMLAAQSGGDVYVSTSTGSSWASQVSLGSDGWTGGFISSDGARMVVISSSNPSLTGEAGNGADGGLSTDAANAGGNGGSVLGSAGTSHNGLPGALGGGGGGGSGGVSANDGGGGGGGAGGEVIVTEVFTGPSTTTLYYMASSTWSKPANLDHVIVQVWGGGGGGEGGGGGGGHGGTGGTSSFTYNSGADTISANGGTGTGSGGTASGGDVNTTGNSDSRTGGADGVTSAFGIPGSGQGGAGGQGGKNGNKPPGGSGPGAGGGGGSNNGASPSNGDGGSGGYAEKTLTASELGSSETVLVGGGGGGGGGNDGAGVGGNGNSSSGSAGGNATGDGGGGGGGGFGGPFGLGSHNTESVENNDTYVSIDGGTSWALATSSMVSAWNTLSASADAMTIFGIDGIDGYLYLSTDGGVNFAAVGTSTISSATVALVTPDASTLVAYDGNDTMYTSTNDGTNWTAHTGQSTYDWSALTSSSDGSILYGTDGDNGKIYESTTTADSWTLLSAGPSDTPSLADSSDGSVILASASGNQLNISEDGGATWAAQSGAGSRSWVKNALAVSGDGSIFIAAESGDPAVWVGIPPEAAPTFSSITATSITSSGATITWTTNEAASTKVIYSTDTSYASSTTETNLSPGVTSHSASLSGLSSCTTYKYEVVSGGASVTYATSTGQTFETTGCVGNTATAVASAGLPWCSGPFAPGWNTNLPGGGCGNSTGVMPGTPITPAIAPKTTPTASTTVPAYTFTRDLHKGMSGPDVLALQQYLNAHGFVLAQSGLHSAGSPQAGSPGNETDYFGTLTFNALVAFQNANASDILAPVGLSQGTGYFGPGTRAFVNSHR